MNEIEDAMAARVHAGDDRGPCNGALGRNGGSQTLEIALLAEAIHEYLGLVFYRLEGWI